MIRIKTKEELKILREGGRKLAAILDAVAKLVQPGVDTGQLEEEAIRLYAEFGGRPAFKGLKMPDDEVFPTALCTSINDEVVHAPALPARVLKNGDIVKVDLGLEYPCPNTGKPRNRFSPGGGYYTDICRTVIVGEAGEEVAKLVKATLESLYAGIKQVKPGKTLNDIGTAIQDYAESRGYSIVRELVGHGVGHEVHEAPHVPNYRITDRSLKNEVLRPGMVLAIEPMVNIGSWQVETADDGFTFVTADRSLSAQFEHTVAVTDKGCEILTLP